MARSFATATVKPRGWKLAWFTQEASMALVSSPFLAVIMYSPAADAAQGLFQIGVEGFEFLDFALLSQGLAQVGAGLFAVLVDSFCGGRP